MKKVKYLIIGGGVSGLAFANFIKSDDFLILEKENELGGYCRTINQDGFIWDYAGHFFHFATEKLKSFFKTRINNNQLVERTKNTKIFFDDMLIDFPFQSNIHQLKKEKFIECLYDLYFRNDKSEYHSFLDMLYAKFGESITKYFLRPYNEKLYACDLNKLDVDAMGRFFPYAEIEQVIASFKKQSVESYNSTFLYPKNGARVFVDALSKDLHSEKIILNCKVENVCLKNKVVTATNGSYRFEHLINSSPLHKLMLSIKNKNYKKIAKELSYNKVLVFNLGFNKKSKNVSSHWIYFPQKDINFYRVGFYDNILNESRLSLYVEIGYASESEINIKKQMQLTLDCLRKTNIISDHELISSCHIIMDPAYVHVSKKSNEIKENFMMELKKSNAYSIGRYGDWKYCSIEDSMLDAVNLANELKNV